MKKTLSLGGVILLAFLAFSCQIEKIESPDAKQASTTYKFTVQDRVWTSDQTRTAYTEGVGIGLTGTENISLFYVDGSGDVVGSAMSSTNSPGWKATPTGAPGEYSFTGPTLDGTYKCYAIMPYSKKNTTLLAKTSGNKTVSIGLSHVQYPSANSFDPRFDFMVGHPFDLGTGATGATVTSFKRLFSPLKILLSGLDSSEKVYAVSIKLAQAGNVNNNQCLTGLFNLSLSENYDEVTLTAANNVSAGNGVTALYPDGLSKGTEGWPVWFLVNPITINQYSSGTTRNILSLTVCTANKTYTREITLPKQNVDLAADKFNEIKIDVKGSKYVEKDSFTQFFIPTDDYTSGSNNLVGSDGVTRNWMMSGTKTCWDTSLNTRDNGSGLPNGLYLYTNRLLYFPSVEGKALTKAIIFPHPNTQSYSAVTGDVLTLNDGTNDLMSFYYNATSKSSTLPGLYVMGGQVAFDYPDLTGMRIKGSTYINVISAITVITENADPAADLKITVPISTGNYLQWPFSSPAESTLATSWGSAGLKDTETEFIAKSAFGGYTFKVYGKDGIVRNSKAGLVIGQTAGDYLEFPAIEGYKLSWVKVCMGYANSNGIPKITETDGTTMVTGGDAYESTFAGEYHLWTLSGTAANTAYRITTTQDVKLQIRNFTLGYTAVP